MLVRLLYIGLYVTSFAYAFRAPDYPQKNKVVEPSKTRMQIATQDSLTKGNKRVFVGRPTASRHNWGAGKTYESEYWRDPRIHTFGNVGFWGSIHAFLAPLSTKIIDVLAYEGTDIRQVVAEELSQRVKSSKTRVLDLCCGVGISTRALHNAFPDAEAVIGVDSSYEMISMANFLSRHLSMVKPLVNKKGLAYPAAATTFTRANAEMTSFPKESFDLVTVMYAFHEAPKTGRDRILREAARLLGPGGTLAVIDICTDYTPSKSMLAGEPYVLEYQKNIHKQLRTFRGFGKVTYKTLVPNHVGMWVLERGLF